jgi:5-methylcytosine-specific restriction endonuclease McrA
MPFKDKSKKIENRVKYAKDRKQHTIDSITSGTIIDRHKWDLWCKEIKRSAEHKKQPYSNTFTNDLVFDMLLQGCFYCGNIATTIDRINSKLDHTPDNCVASCLGCNNSKGVADTDTFLKKAYYRARREYVDDDTIVWYEYLNKPDMSAYKMSAQKRKVSFELTNEVWDTLIKGDCEYCKRTPDKWFGIDRVVPSVGYVLGNIVSCCWDCNLDKHEDDVETMMRRNERIASRVDNGVLVIGTCEKILLHNGTQKKSNNICAYGKVYSSKRDASRALGQCGCYVRACISHGRYKDDIFEISKEFYDFAVETKLENITRKMYILFNRM